MKIVSNFLGDDLIENNLSLRQVALIRRLSSIRRNRNCHTQSTGLVNFFIASKKATFVFVYE